MSKYVISDVHGCYDKFLNMLDLINFKEDDELYILGDIFDRGKEPLKILDYIVGHKNITLLKGNHEKLFEEAFETGDYRLWYYNGGQSTHSKLIEGGLDREQQVYHYIRRLPLIKVVDKFILVHAGLYFPNNYNDLELDEFIKQQEEEICLWDRSNINFEWQYKDYIVISGHTVVKTINNNCESILHKQGHIYIDCGCCFEHINGKLACLRLDDMKEFYI